MKRYDYDPNLQILTFCPRIKGIAGFFRVRAIRWKGLLWLLAQDVGCALGWTPGTIVTRSRQKLTGDAWGLSYIATDQGQRLRYFVSSEGLEDLLNSVRSRQAWAFRRWLSTLDQR